MTLWPYASSLTGTPYKYLESLDRPTRERIRSKLLAIAESPFDARRLSKPLVNQNKRSSRVGTYPSKSSATN
jgi:mRNA-degrading endonuclease RelE of RelBE toxin-antitoxin system